MSSGNAPTTQDDNAALQEAVQRAINARLAQEQSSAPGYPPPYDDSYTPVGPSFQQPGQPGPTYIIVQEEHPQVEQREVWSVAGHGGAIPQPDQGRIVISGTARVRRGFFSDSVSSVSYVYADELPCREKFIIVLAVLMAILGTPVTLLCTLPAILLIQQVSSMFLNGVL